MTKPQPWSIELAQRLLKEAPSSMPLIEVFALALEDERERAAVIAEKYTRDWKEVEPDKTVFGWGKARTEIAKRIRDGR